MIILEKLLILDQVDLFCVPSTNWQSTTNWHQLAKHHQPVNFHQLASTGITNWQPSTNWHQLATPTGKASSTGNRLPTGKASPTGVY